MDVAILAHDRFPDDAKTAVGVLRYGDHDVRAVLDRSTAGDRVHDHLPDVQDAPIVASMDEVPDVDALLIGIAPIGGGFEDDWRPDVRAALKRGCDVIAGLHYMLSADEEFAALAADHGAELRDLRRPPEDLSVADGTAGAVDADVVLTVGTDCSTGKMTTSFELRDAARERGIDAAVVPTGQTGIAIADRGIAIDRVIADFAAGAVEGLVEEQGDRDLLIVEGQGALVHPAYSGVTTSILHGAQPDALVLCHVAGREVVHGYESFPLPAVERYADLYERMASPVSGADVVAGALNTRRLDESGARDAVAEYGDALGVPATDPVRFDADEILEALP
ncbi:DUF1611 domain-containing protein [Halomicrobium salinisoli]|uniref:DUF1611 domain-containing protein n=1 Tax=Halomicrobium salinisoli TaxID=2878391 RepID=UPI001CF01175|nr:DUF1611 domain-containing protein [Halomicrobium salinisoli]